MMPGLGGIYGTTVNARPGELLANVIQLDLGLLPGLVVNLVQMEYTQCTLVAHLYAGDDTMTALEALQSVQFVTAKGKRLAVLNAEDWEALIEWLETLEDTSIVREALAELKVAGGDRRRAGWLEWKLVSGEIE